MSVVCMLLDFALGLAALLVGVLVWLGILGYEPPPRGYRGRR